MATKIAKPRKTGSWVRRGVQIFFFLLVVVISTTSALKEKGIALPLAGSASLHAVCPFGGVVSFWQLATAGTLVKKVHDSSVVLAVISIVLLVLAGPVVCGWVCPLGSLQEWLAGIGRKLFGKRYNTFVPPKVDRVLRYSRYLVFVWVSWMTIMTGKLFFQEYDPYFALFQFWTGEVALSAFLILGATLVLNLFVERPFCKYACPFGAFQGIFNLFRIFGIKRNAPTCISCKKCDKACPMNIEVSTASVVRDHQCISCLECTSERSCPVENTMVLGAGAFAEGGKK
jgi:polyferredoxin